MKTISSFMTINVLLIILLLFAATVRFYNFSQRITFGPEQAISLLVSGDYIREKFSLLGLPNVQRVTSSGHILYSPALFNYSLVPLMVLFKNDPVLITLYFAFLNLVTGLVLFIVIRKMFNREIALFSAAIFLFNDSMIFHSMFIWILNYMPLLNIIIGYLFFRLFKRRNSKIFPFLIGLLLSICFGLEYLYIFTALVLFWMMIYVAGKKLTAFLFFMIGAILGNLPTIIFDFLHGFYHAKTLWQYLLDTLSNPGQSKIAYYHFLQFWPFFSVLGGIILYQIYKQSRLASLVLLFSIISINLLSANVSFVKPKGMYPGLNYPKLNEAAKIIAGDNPQDFNVVMTFDFDSRAHPLRYLLKYKYGFLPRGVEDYPKSKNLYILTNNKYPILRTNLWEISSSGKNKVETLGEIDNFVVYKLTKNN